jgi:hypothetical protein
MSRFWESSPEWQRKQELDAKLGEALKARDEAARRVLYCIEVDADSPHGSMWSERREAYKDASRHYEDTCLESMKADAAFAASSAGQAERRYFADPIARASSPAVEEVA